MPSLPTAEIQVLASEQSASITHGIANPDQALEAIDRIGIGVEVEGAVKEVNDEERKYYQTLFRTVNKIYKEKFPEIYREGLVDKIRYTYWEPHDGEVMMTGAVSYNPFTKIMSCVNGTPIINTDTASKDRVESGMGFTVQRIVADAGSFAHEYTHQIYENLSPSDLKQPDDFSTADQTFNEGFAMMMQYLFLDALKRDPQLLGLDTEGVEDLNRYFSTALYGRGEDVGLRGFDQVYVQGTLKVLHKIFAEAAGPPKTRDVSKGLIAMKTFVQGLDRTKTIQTDNQDPEFQTLVKAKDIDSLRQVYTYSLIPTKNTACQGL